MTNIRHEADKIFGYFYHAYVNRFHEQGLTGKAILTINFFKGGVGHPNFEDYETKKMDELKGAANFSEQL